MKEKINKLIRKIFPWRIVKPLELPVNTKARTLILTDIVEQRIQALKDRTEIRDTTQLFRNALGSFDVLTEHILNDGKVILRDKDGTERIFDPISMKEELPEE